MNISDLTKAFNRIYNNDKGSFPAYISDWPYQDTPQNWERDHNAGLGDPFNFRSIQDLVQFWDWGVDTHPAYFEDYELAPLVKRIVDFDKYVARKCQLLYDFTKLSYIKGIATVSAQEYLLNHLYPDPYISDTLRVCDFGSGFGRQACAWNLFNSTNLTFISIDAIQKPYITQAIYYSFFDVPLTEYVIDPLNFKLDYNSRGIYHLPTWRLSLLPDNYLDKVLFCQVLPELDPSLIEHVIPLLFQKLKPGGTFFIRDHGTEWQPVHSIDTDKMMLSLGMHLEFNPLLVDKKHIHGKPRIFRKHL